MRNLIDFCRAIVLGFGAAIVLSLVVYAFAKVFLNV